MLAMPKDAAQVATTPTLSVATLMKGRVEVPADQITTFIAPLLGFENLRRFYIYQTEPGPMHWLQSLDDPRVAFCLLAPFAAGLDPDVEIGLGDVADIGALGLDDIDVYTIVVLDRDPREIRTNLRAPVLVGRRSGLAKQLVLNNPRLPIRFRLCELKKRTA